MKRVFISGADGNMGQRYIRVCKALGLDVCGVDQVSFYEQATWCGANDIDGIIVATPTFTHVDAIHTFGQMVPDIPMLVEKPFRIGRFQTNPAYKLTMVNQYKYLVDNSSIGHTYYSYFKTGGDGLLWDCINIIGLAKSEVSIKNDSPFWRCMINGKRLNIQDMDGAYLDMIKDWSRNPVGNRKYFEEAHKKVFEMSRPRRDKAAKDIIGVKTDVIPILGRTND